MPAGPPIDSVRSRRRGAGRVDVTVTDPDAGQVTPAPEPDPFPEPGDATRRRPGPDFGWLTGGTRPFPGDRGERPSPVFAREGTRLRPAPPVRPGGEDLIK
jgi:hypothetical protein